MHVRPTFYHSNELIALKELLWSIIEVELGKRNLMGKGDIKLCSREAAPTHMTHMTHMIWFV